MKYYAIIVAGGTGNRMKSAVPKQFLLLSGKPVLMHTIEAFHFSTPHPDVIVVMNQSFTSQWEELCLKHRFDIPVTIVNGGKTRFESVRNGLSHVSENSIVAVHDAVRPLVSNSLITASFENAALFGSAVPAVTSKDSIRQGTEQASITLNREQIFLVQTPQTFKSEILKKAYLQEDKNFTDDASVVEQSGESIRMIGGDPSNIKITFPEDLAVAEALLGPEK